MLTLGLNNIGEITSGIGEKSLIFQPSFYNVLDYGRLENPLTEV